LPASAVSAPESPGSASRFTRQRGPESAVLQAPAPGTRQRIRRTDRLAAMTSFVKVVENSGFSAAARRLEVSTSIVTMHIKSLEDRLGVLLLNRNTRKVSLTDIGRAYYERCVQILSKVHDADQVAELLQAKPRGVLRVNLAPHLSVMIAPSIGKFVALYPEASVRITVTNQMVSLIEEGFDLAIRIGPASDSRLIVRRLALHRYVVCGAPSYFAHRGRPEHPSELVRHNCLLFSDSHSEREWHFAGPDGKQAVRLSGDLEANSGEVLRVAAVRGQGLIYVPVSLVASELKSGQLVPILTQFRPVELSINALYPHRRHVSAKVRSFIDLLVNDLRNANGMGVGSRDSWTSDDEVV
jgi:DNA-binding transcriptional LysR family regulator